jgi:hypothetical protein
VLDARKLWASVAAFHPSTWFVRRQLDVLYYPCLIIITITTATTTTAYLIHFTQPLALLLLQPVNRRLVERLANLVLADLLFSILHWPPLNLHVPLECLW